MRTENLCDAYIQEQSVFASDDCIFGTRHDTARLDALALADFLSGEDLPRTVLSDTNIDPIHEQSKTAQYIRTCIQNGEGLFDSDLQRMCSMDPTLPRVYIELPVETIGVELYYDHEDGVHMISLLRSCFLGKRIDLSSESMMSRAFQEVQRLYRECPYPLSLTYDTAQLFLGWPQAEIPEQILDIEDELAQFVVADDGRITSVDWVEDETAPYQLFAK